MRLLLSFSLLGLLPASAFAQGYSAEEAPSKMTLAPGFHAELVVSEPIIAQPVAIDFDDRGRLWCIQYLQYPNPKGLKRVNVDRYSRTTYDRIPEPPPHGPKGADAITIMEDTDGDGKIDTHKNFVEELNLCSGMAFGHGGVFVLNVPYLLFYPDKNQDDVPDSDPEVLLTGFGMEDAHSVANSLTWGPDGWLYGNQGSTVTAHIRGIEFQQGIWRYHPLTKEFELFAEGGGNMWGMDYDPHGQLLVSTNAGPHLLLHPVQGGYYWKSFGKHGALHNPFAFGYFEHAEHLDPQGGHVMVGGQIYQADAYPAEYRGLYINANLLSHNVYYNDLIPIGSTFKTQHKGELLNANDTWFAPSDMTTGPDGCLYVTDWNDKRTAHPDPDAEWDRSNGRVYRIAHEQSKRVTPFNLREKSSVELVDLLEHPNVWYRRHARTLLAERRDASVLPRLREQVKSATDNLALESFWALYVSGGFDEAQAMEYLHHKNPDIRRWAVRFLGDTRQISKDNSAQLVSMAQEDQDIYVRSQLACTAKRLPLQDALAIVKPLLARGEDAQDLHIPLLLWWAVEAHAMEEPEAVLAQLHTPELWRAQIAAETVLPRLIRRYAADGSAAGDRAATAMLETVPQEKQEVLLAALEQGLQERGKVELTKEAMGNLFETFAVEQQTEKTRQTAAPSEELINTVNRLYGTAPDSSILLRLATRLGNEAAYARAKERAQDAALPAEDRVAMLSILGRFGKNEATPLLFGVLNSEKDQAVRFAALDALRHYSEDSVGIELLNAYAKAEDQTKERLRDVMFSKPTWAGQFLAAVDQGKITTEEVPLTQLRTISHHNDEALNALVEKHWGVIKEGTPEEKLAEMRRMNNELNAGPGDPARGKKVFEENCIKCHTLFNEGAKIGPDLTQANRMDREYMLVSLVDPSFMVRKEYQQYIVETEDGGLYNGVLGEGPEGTVTIYDANAQPNVLQKDQITNMREHTLSLMPEGLLTPLPGDSIRDLFAYVQSSPEKK